MIRASISEREKIKRKKINTEIMREKSRAWDALPRILVTSSTLKVQDDNTIRENFSNIKVDNPSKIPGEDSSSTDLRLGSSDRSKKQCLTCNDYGGSGTSILSRKLIEECPGHYGVIDFGGNYIYHPQFIQHIPTILNLVCDNCGNLLIGNNSLKKTIKNIPKKSRIAYLSQHTKDFQPCLNKSDDDKVISCGNTIKYSLTKEDTKKGRIQAQVKEPSGDKSEKKIADIGHIRDVLEGITPEAKEYMGFDRDCDLTWLIMGNMPVLPNISRPASIELEGRPKLAYFTELYSQIITILENINENKDKRTSSTKTYTIGDLYLAVYNFYAAKKPDDGKGDKLSIKASLQGKEGFFRSYLIAKRGDQAARTVLGSMRTACGYIGIPNKFREELTKPVRVTDFNIEEIKEDIKNGDVKYVTNPSKQLTTKLINGKIKKGNIRPGMIVARKLKNGDLCLFNRQPTLHKYSCMGATIIIVPSNTNKIWIGATSPYNADFDGDEGNIYNIQRLLAEAETKYLMHIKKNNLNDRSSANVYGLVMSQRLASYLLSSTEKIPPYLFSVLLENNGIQIAPDFEERCEKYGIYKYSGKALISTLLPPDFYYNHAGVKIYEGIFFEGLMNNNHIGISVNSIPQKLAKDYPGDLFNDSADIKFLSDATTLLNDWIEARGFTVSIMDCIPNIDSQEEYKKEVERTLSEVEKLGAPNGVVLHDKFLEEAISIKLSKLKEITLKLSATSTDNYNNISVMIKGKSGAKGDSFNTNQIMYSLGQQYFQNKRPTPSLGHIDTKMGVNARTSPVFDPRDTHPTSHGYILNSFTKGLDLPEMMMAAKVSREGLTSTNFKTAEVGALARSMSRLFESVVISTGGAVVYNNIMVGNNFNSGYNTRSMRLVEVDGEKKFMPFDIASLTAKLNIENGFIDYETDEESDDEEEEIDWDLTEQLVSELKPRKHSRYEACSIIGHRAEQLSFNAKPRVKIGKMTNALDIAEKEYVEGKIDDLFILRQYMDGTIVEV